MGVPAALNSHGRIPPHSLGRRGRMPVFKLSFVLLAHKLDHFPLELNLLLLRARLFPFRASALLLVFDLLRAPLEDPGRGVTALSEHHARSPMWRKRSPSTSPSAHQGHVGEVFRLRGASL